MYYSTYILYVYISVYLDFHPVGIKQYILVEM